MFTKLSRTDGKGEVHLSGHWTVAVFETQAKTVIRTAAGGDSTSFVVIAPVEDVVRQLSESGAKFIRLTRKKAGDPLYVNVSQIVGVYERADATVIRTTAGGEPAEHAVSESASEVEAKLSEFAAPSTTVSNPLISEFIKAPNARRRGATKTSAKDVS